MNQQSSLGDLFLQEVVGESYYQEALWRVVGSRTPVDHRQHPVQVALVWEHDNPYDPNAIAVHAAGPNGYEKVGHLPAERAAQFRPEFEELERRGYGAAVCEARIVGGFRGDDGATAFLGIWLNMALPGSLLPPPD